MNDESQNRKAAPIGGAEPKSTADRVRQIQEMQRAAEALPIAKPQTPVVAKPAATLPSAAVNDLWNVKATQAVAQNPLATKTTAKEAVAFAKAQVEPSALFGAKGSDIEIVGNPWKIISFNESLPVVFEPPRGLENYEAKVPEKAAKTEHGLLFTATLASKDGAEEPRTRSVLVSPQGALVGAECESAFILDRLIKRLPSLPLAKAIGQEKFKVTDGKDSRFEITLAKSGKTFRASNFGLLIPEGQPASRFELVVAQYHLDGFDAAR